MLFFTIHVFIFCFIFGCLLAFYFKCLLIVTFSQRLTLLETAYTFYLSIIFKTIQWIKNVYQYSICNVFSKWRKRSTSITSNLMDFVIPPQLAVTVKSKTCTKTVWAIIDTGAGKSFISAKLAKELSFEIQESQKKKKFVDVLIGKPNGNDFSKIKLELTSVLTSSKNTSILCCILKFPMYLMASHYLMFLKMAEENC